MEKFLTYRAIFAFVIPTVAIVTTAIVLIVLALILLLALFLSSRRRRKIAGPPAHGTRQQQGAFRPASSLQQPEPHPLAQQPAGWGYDSSAQQPTNQGHEPSTPQPATWRYNPSPQQSADWQQHSPTTLQPTQDVTEGPVIPQKENPRQTPPSKGQETVIPSPPDKAPTEVTTTYSGFTPSSFAGRTPVRQSPPPARVVIRTKNGQILREFLIAKRETSIGRISSNDIPLSQDKLTSRRHATIRYQNGNYVLYDEQSVNGTFVNGQQLDQRGSRILHNGDRIGIGEYELTFYGHSVSPSAQNMPPATGQYAPLPIEATQYASQDTFYAAPAEHDISSSRSTGEGASDPFAQWAPPVPGSAPAQPPESRTTPQAQPSATPSSQTGIYYSPPEAEPSEKQSTISPAPPPPRPVGSSGAPPNVPTSLQTSATSSHSPEQLRFTAFHPKEVAVESWNTLLVYAHIESAIEAIHKDVQRFKAELGAAPRKISAPATRLLLRETNISIVPECKGVTFNPRRITFKWLEDWHRGSFRFQAKSELAGSAGNGRINIFAGPLLVGTLKMPMLFAEPDALPPQKEEAGESGQLYKQIFASYSHDDSLIVLTCRDVFKAIGYQTLIDIDTLRAGQKFSDALKRMIDIADIFQLFWSERAAKSRYVTEEWEYALNLNKGEGFVRPVYWELPMVAPPTKLAPLHFAYLPVYTFNQQSPSS